MSFKNKVVLITGGSAGIGAVTAEYFAKNGANVAIVARNKDKLNQVAEQCQKYGVTILVLATDITEDENLKSMFKRFIEKFGKLDILVNNAGVFNTVPIISPNSLEVYDGMHKLNLRSVIHLTNLAAPFLKETKGVIINVSSVVANTLAAKSVYGMYSAIKTALNQFSRATALELGSSGVRVNVVSPGPTRTGMLDNLDPGWGPDDYARFSVNNSIARPEDIAKMILFLASDESSSITGANFVVDNGALLVA